MTWLRFVLVLWSLVTASTARAGVTVAVLPFDAGTSDPEFTALGVGLQSMLITDLAQAGEVEIVERARLGDIVAELELSRSGLVDPKTAVQIGKIVAATHVVAGSFTVSGARMRLDARITSVKTGKVTIAAEQSGARDAFFELEKALVDDLLADMGTQLSAQGRLAVARNATDFGTFVTYSEGVALYDADRYELAVQALEQAARSDSGFALATTTLEAIRAARAEVRDRSQQLQIARAEEAFAARSAEAAAAWRAAEALDAIRRNEARPVEDRITAAVLVAQLSTRMGHTDGLEPMFTSGDRFALRRWGERAYQHYWQLTMSIAPRAIPLRRGTRFDPTDDVEEVVADLREDLFAEKGRLSFANCHDTRAGVSIKDAEAVMLWLPLRERQERLVEALKAGHDCFDALGRGNRNEDASDYEEGLVEVAKTYLSIGEIERATRLYRTAAQLTRGEYLLRKIGEALDDSAALQAKLNALKPGTQGYELMKLAQDAPTYPAAMSCEVDAEVRRTLPRRWKSDEKEWPLFLAGVPAWLLTSKSRELTSGPRTSLDEAEAIRHYRSSRGDPEEPTAFVLGGSPLADMTATVQLDFSPAADWWPTRRSGSCPRDGLAPDWAPAEGRPVAGLLFGLRDLETMPRCDPADPTQLESVPTRGYGALVLGGKLVIAEVIERFPEPETCSRHFDPRLRGLEVGKVLAQMPMKRGRATVSLTVQGRKVVATAGNAKVAATLPEARPGFVGLLADGVGYVELARPTLRGL